MNSKRVFAPEGHVRIAQRFIAGSGVHQAISSPGGTAEMSCVTLIQSSLRDYPFSRFSNPAINRWAIFKRPSGTGKHALNLEFVSPIMASATR